MFENMFENILFIGLASPRRSDEGKVGRSIYAPVCRTWHTWRTSYVVRVRKYFFLEPPEIFKYNQKTTQQKLVVTNLVSICHWFLLPSVNQEQGQTALTKTKMFKIDNCLLIYNDYFNTYFMTCIYFKDAKKVMIVNRQLLATLQTDYVEEPI